jgi:hypothetical protein
MHVCATLGYTEGCFGGVAIEHIIRLANQAGVDPWVTIPYNADDNYISSMANLVNELLRPDLVRA